MGLVEILKMLPGLIVLANKIMDWVKQSGHNNPQELIRLIGEAFGQLAQAKTGDEKFEAAKKIQDLIARR